MGASCAPIPGEGIADAFGSPSPGSRKRDPTSPLPKSDVSDLGHFKVPNSGKPEFGWGEV